MTAPAPAEWAPHLAMWLGFPSHAELWGEHLAWARSETAALALALAGPGGESVKLLAADGESAATARHAVGHDQAIEVLEVPFGDVWLRDTGPVFTGAGEAAAFVFNGWGGKYELSGDKAVADAISRLAGARLRRHDFVLEGGAIDHDGAGTAIVTRQCLLNPNRNSAWRETQAQDALRAALGVRKTVWLDEGIVNDHTDGHVDNLARFVGRGVVACPAAFGPDDPNVEVYDEAARVLGGATDARGARLDVARIPSPGRILDEMGAVAPASHMNFLIANEAVIMPLYEPSSAALAGEVLQSLFAGRRVIALASRALLTGGGSFHCISQQQPL